MLDELRRWARKLPYFGASIVFAHAGSEGWEVLLFRRNCNPANGKWSFPGGQQAPGESYQQTAAREAREEALGGKELMDALRDYLPPDFSSEEAPEHIAYDIPCTFGWRTYLVELQTKPSERAFRLNWENSEVQWFRVDNLPSDIHSEAVKSIRHFGLDRGKPT